MLDTLTCYVVRCDDCKRPTDQEDYEVHHPTEADARARAEEVEYQHVLGRDLCPSCTCARSGHQQPTVTGSRRCPLCFADLPAQVRPASATS